MYYQDETQEVNAQSMQSLFANFNLDFKPTEKKIRNNTDLIKEEIWKLIEKDNKKASRKLFFIKTAKVPDYELLSIQKWALTTDNFSRAFYGAIKKYNRKIDGLDK